MITKAYWAPHCLKSVSTVHIARVSVKMVRTLSSNMRTFCLNDSSMILTGLHFYHSTWFFLKIEEDQVLFVVILIKIIFLSTTVDIDLCCPQTEEVKNLRIGRREVIVQV